MKAIIFTVVLCLTGIGLNAQNLIAVQNGGEPTFYTELDLAITNAQNGDTIYIPGGSYALTNNINKNLHIVGVGHNPDSTTATNYTMINSSISLKHGASNGSLSGIYLISGIEIYDSLFNYTLKRCNVGQIIFHSSTSNYNTFSENIIRGKLDGANSFNNIFLNNVIGITGSGYWGFDGFSSGTVFKNNIIFRSLSMNNYSIYSTVFENNIFIGSGSLYVTNCLFNNNLCDSSSNLGCGGGGCILNSNIINQSTTSIFYKYSGTGSFNYTDDYHLKPTCPGKNAGKDGTDIGIYGGAFPWKEGSLPFNPHFQKIQISPKTDNNDNLNVNIKVAAQQN